MADVIKDTLDTKQLSDLLQSEADAPKKQRFGHGGGKPYDEVTAEGVERTIELLRGMDLHKTSVGYVNVRRLLKKPDPPKVDGVLVPTYDYSKKTIRTIHKEMVKRIKQLTPAPVEE